MVALHLLLVVVSLFLFVLVQLKKLSVVLLRPVFFGLPTDLKTFDFQVYFSLLFGVVMLVIAFVIVMLLIVFVIVFVIAIVCSGYDSDSAYSTRVALAFAGRARC